MVFIIFKRQNAVQISHTHMYLMLQANRGRAPKYQTIRLPGHVDQQSGSVRLAQAAGLPRRRTSTTSTRGRVELSWMQTCPHPSLSLLALLPVSQSTWLRPSARVPTPDRANGTYASPLEDCSGSRLKLLVLRVPPSVWHRGSNLGLVSTSFGPMGWSGICVAGHHRASIPHSRRPFPWCGQPRSRLIEHWVVVESKFGMSWQSILPRAILDPSQAAYLFLSIHSTADSHAPACARLYSRWFGTITAWLLEGRSDHCWLVGAPRTPPSDKLSWIYCGLQECLYASRQPSSPSSFRSHSIHLPANLH